MAVFGLICEGITDQIVIKNILSGYFDNKDLNVDMLQPLRDATDENLALSSGNWHQVFEYCESSAFKEAFLVQEDYYVIIQLDTDFLFTEYYSKEDYPILTHNELGIRLSVEELVKNVVTFLIKKMGETFYENNNNYIIFAISVDSIECWLLPIYFNDNKKSKTTNCLETLNKALNKTHGFTINAKNPDYYRTASKPFLKHKTLIQNIEQNPSLHLFINNLISKNIIITEEEDW